MPVITPFELDDPIASRRGPRHTHGAHRRFGARADEPDPLDRRHQRAYALAQRRFERARRPEAGAEACGSRQRLYQPHRRVAVDERSPRHHVVDEPVAVDVLDAGAGRAPDEQRRRADRLEGAHRTVDAPGKDLTGA